MRMTPNDAAVETGNKRVFLDDDDDDEEEEEEVDFDRILCNHGCSKNGDDGFSGYSFCDVVPKERSMERHSRCI